MFEQYNNKKKEIDENFNVHLRHNIKPMKEGSIIAFIYGIFGILWIAFSDAILLYIVDDIEVYRELQTIKGWIFVLISVFLIYSLVKIRSELYRKSINDLQNSYQELETVYEELEASNQEILVKDTYLEYEKNLNNKIFNNANVLICIWDHNGVIKEINPYTEKVLGYEKKELIASNWLDLLGNQNEGFHIEKVIKGIQDNKFARNHENELITKDKKRIQILWNTININSNDELPLMLSIGSDLSVQKKLQFELDQAMHSDYLTVLQNRSHLYKSVIKAVNKNEKFSLVVMDLDNFKYINEKFGHDVGDLLLKHIAKNLQDIVDYPNEVVRLGGDEFSVLLYEDDQDKIREEVNMILSRLGNTLEINNYKLYFTFSTGVSIYPKDSGNYLEIFRNAEMAMHQVKKSGKHKLLFYNEQLENKSLESIKMANELEKAINNKSFELYFQPQLRLSSNELTGIEALIRWNHPEKGFISPGIFIKLAEETGQIYALEQWVFNEALMQKETYEQEKRFNQNLEISINLSSKSLMSESAFEKIEGIFKAYDINYSEIIVEITETAVIDKIDIAIQRLKRLKKMGVKIALDDFGTGYSSLTYLKKLPIDIVKFDRSFISVIDHSEKDQKIVQSMLNLVDSLGYKVVAEGIETKEQLEYLCNHNCDFGQGYLLSKPMRVEDIIEYRIS
jgi:diguanylate cyclase (GGDEF)-like protein/PAS domain S-box-containing protein